MRKKYFERNFLDVNLTSNPDLSAFRVSGFYVATIAGHSFWASLNFVKIEIKKEQEGDMQFNITSL